MAQEEPYFTNSFRRRQKCSHAPAVWRTSWLTRTRLSCRDVRCRCFSPTSSGAREATSPSHDLPPASRACRGVPVCPPCTRSWQCPASVPAAQSTLTAFLSVDCRTRTPAYPSLPNDLSTLLHRQNAHREFHISTALTRFCQYMQANEYSET